MTKKRASIRGRGAEILFGDPSEVEVEPRAPGNEAAREEPEPETAETAAAEEEGEMAVSEEGRGAPPDAGMGLEWDEDEIEEALREEALDGAPQPSPPPPDAPTRLEVAPPTTPEMEVAFIEEAYAAEEPPDPVAEPPTPTLEETMEEREVQEEAAMYEPPPPEVDSVSAGVVPPRPEPRYFEMDTEAMLARDIQEPERPVETIKLPERDLTEEEKAEILARLGEEWIQKLQAEIDDAYEDVRRKAGENEAVTIAAYNRLLRARDILVLRKVDQLAQAEYYLELVRARIKRVSESESAAKKYQWPLLSWGLFWGVAFLVLLILLGQDWFREIVAPAGSADSLMELDIFVSAMLWGGVGGAVAVLYSLFKHVGERDFDSQYLISYVGKPFLGLVVGATVYMVFNLVIRALGIFPAGMQTAEGDVAPTVAPGVVYLMAWASGFKEDRILSLIDRVMAQIFGKDEEEEEVEGDANNEAPAQ